MSWDGNEQWRLCENKTLMRTPELKERSSRESGSIFRVEEEQFLYPEDLGNIFLWIADAVPIYHIPWRHIHEGPHLINATFGFREPFCR
jgi:hypothetical protein